MTDNGWTPERRKRQAEKIRNWMPWNHSTGPKTAAGKEACKMNAQKHGAYSARTKLIRRLLKEQADMLERLT